MLRSLMSFALAFALITGLTVSLWAQTESQTLPEAPATTTETPAPAPAPETPAAEAPAPAPATAVPASLNPEEVFVNSEEEARALGPKNAAFMDVDKVYRAELAELVALKNEYPRANATRQAEIMQSYKEIYAKADAKRAELLNLGTAAFNEAPNRNPLVVDLLYPMVEWEYRRDNFEPSYSLFKLITEKGLLDGAELLYVYGGFSALMTMHLDDAEAWLNKADSEGKLKLFYDSFGEEREGMIERFKLQEYHETIPTYRKTWAVEQEIRKRQQEAGEADPGKKLPRVVLHTNKGDIVLELFEDDAPNTVANFISLVEREMAPGHNYYDGVPFHRVLPAFMAQGGDPSGTGMGGPGYTIKCECRKPDYRKHFRGSLSMAKTSLPDTGGSQFFLTFVPTTMLDGQHTVFGRVVEGMDVLAKIQRIDPSKEEDAEIEPDIIVKAEVLNKRDHEYKPEILSER